MNYNAMASMPNQYSNECIIYYALQDFELESVLLSRTQYSMPHAPRMADFFISPNRRNFRFQSILCEWIFPHRSKCWLSLYRHTLNRILSDSIHIFMYYLQIVTWKLGETCLAKSSFETLQSFKIFYFHCPLLIPAKNVKSILWWKNW